MGKKVAKFGGTSVADGIQLRKTKNIIEADKDLKYIVVSAPGKRFSQDNKITDLLYLCRASMEHNLPYEQLFQVVIDRFMAVKASIGVTVDMEHEFQDIKEHMAKGCSEDYVASRGEYLNAVLMAAYLGYDFVDTQGLVLFDDRGRLLIEETNEALKEELAKHENAVLPGFYGSDIETGEIKTFSRGGSDITGALVARAVDADVYENWTDVPGFLIADPRIVDNPNPINRISYKELRELSYMGASVLHEDAIYPARIASIPINIKDTNEPELPGTLITNEPDDEGKHIITGIAGSRDFTVIALYKSLMRQERGFFRRIFAILDDFDISFEHLPSGIDTISVVISNKNLDGKLEDLLEAFRVQLNPDSMEYYENIALIATVGNRMNRKPGVAARLFNCLAEADVNIRMIDQGSSEINIIVGVENKDFEKAIKAIYNEFETENNEGEDN